MVGALEKEVAQLQLLLEQARSEQINPKAIVADDGNSELLKQQVLQAQMNADY